jgi:uncharacterized membrane protein YtjA (UPF0391 family)
LGVLSVHSLEALAGVEVHHWQYAIPTVIRRITMLSWAVTFLIIAIIAAVLGFGGIAGTATGIAKILFVVFLVMFVVSFIFGRRGKG